MGTNVTQQFYTNQEKTWLVILTTNDEADSRQVCSIYIGENPGEGRSQCYIKMYDPDLADELYLDSCIEEGLLISDTTETAKSIILKFENRSKELLNFNSL